MDERLRGRRLPRLARSGRSPSNSSSSAWCATGRASTAPASPGGCQGRSRHDAEAAAGAVELVVGNARHIKSVPGRKTDVKDSEWIADLLRHGLIARSFVPPQPIRVLRDLVRYRRKLVESGSTERNRLLELLETCNIKLASFASNVFGVSGMAMLRALVTNASTPTEMAQLARGRVRDKIPAPALALDGQLDF